MINVDLHDDTRIAFMLTVGGYIHHAILIILGLILTSIGVRVALRSSLAERWLNSGHYSEGDHGNYR